jgi:hypothetical protein
LVEELYGEIRNFSFTPRNKIVMRFQVLEVRLCFFEHKRKKRRRFERILAFLQYVSENSKYASEYPENVSK